MDKNKTLYNQLRGDHNLPTELEWQNVEHNILSKLDSNRKEEDDALPFLYFLIPGILVVGLLASAYNVRHQSISVAEVTAKNHIKSVKGDLHRKHDSSSTKVIDAPEISFDYYTYLKSINNGSRENNSETNSFPISQSALTESNKKDKKNVDSTPLKRQNQKDLASHIENHNIERINNNSVSELTDRNLSFKGIYTLDLNIQKILPVEIDASEKIQLIQPSEKRTKFPKNKLAIEISAGANYIIPNFQGTLIAEEKSRLDKGILNYGATSSLLFKLKQNWFLSAGLSYQKYSSRFEHNGSKTEREMRRRNVLHRNIYTGDTTKVQYFLLQPINQSRVIRHHNHYVILSTPILLHRYWKTRKSMISIGAGFRYNFSFDSQGKTISNLYVSDLDHEVIEFNGDNYYKNSFSFDAILDISYRYNLNQSIFIGVGFSSAFSLSDWTENSAYATKPIMLHSSIKLGYWF